MRVRQPLDATHIYDVLSMQSKRVCAKNPFEDKVCLLHHDEAIGTRVFTQASPVQGMDT